jgi:hypothetical protein
MSEREAAVASSPRKPIAAANPSKPKALLRLLIKELLVNLTPGLRTGKFTGRCRLILGVKTPERAPH